MHEEIFLVQVQSLTQRIAPHDAERMVWSMLVLKDEKATRVKSILKMAPLKRMSYVLYTDIMVPGPTQSHM